jgi:cell division protein FtsB
VYPDFYINAQTEACEKRQMETDDHKAQLAKLRSEPVRYTLRRTPKGVSDIIFQRPLDEALAEKEQLLHRVEKFKKGIADAQAKFQKTSDAIALLENEIKAKGKDTSYPSSARAFTIF